MDRGVRALLVLLLRVLEHGDLDLAENSEVKLTGQVQRKNAADVTAVIVRLMLPHKEWVPVSYTHMTLPTKRIV